MRFARPILTVAVAFALAAYALDCLAMTTPEQAMQCCGSMPCASGGHSSQECCKAMPSQHATFVQPASSHNISHVNAVLALLPTFGDCFDSNSSPRFVAAQSHAPPILNKSVLLPLRI